MPSRVVDGFILTPATEPQEDGAEFYEPSILVRQQAMQRTEVYNHYAISQNVERRSKEEAFALAEQWVDQIQYVRYYGNQWDLG